MLRIEHLVVPVKSMPARVIHAGIHEEDTRHLRPRLLGTAAIQKAALVSLGVVAKESPRSAAPGEKGAHARCDAGRLV